MRISDWSSDVCSSDLGLEGLQQPVAPRGELLDLDAGSLAAGLQVSQDALAHRLRLGHHHLALGSRRLDDRLRLRPGLVQRVLARLRSEEHTSELQSLMRISYAVFCLKKKNT